MKVDTPKLPDGIIPGDLKYPKYWETNDPKDKQIGTFDLWYSAGRNGFGWCIPTLHIANSRQHGERSYAIRVSDGQPVRIGGGPHVTQRLTVYVTEGRKAALEKYLELKRKGEEDANSIRDRISSRRAQGALYRMNRGW